VVGSCGQDEQGSKSQTSDELGSRRKKGKVKTEEELAGDHPRRGLGLTWEMLSMRRRTGRVGGNALPDVQPCTGRTKV